MNQYVIVSFLQKEFPSEFFQSDWPLHATIVRPFFSNKSREEFIHALIMICSQVKPIHTIGKSREMFGPHGDIAVTELENVSSLQALHDQVMNALGRWVEFKTPLYKIYRPHATDQKTGGISLQEKVTISSVSLVELIGDKRRVLETINFQL